MSGSWTRRGFVTSTAGAMAAAWSVTSWSLPTARGDATARGPCDRIHLGLIGCGAIMRRHVEHLAAASSAVAVTHVCDVDAARAAAVGARVARFQQHAPQCVRRYEQLLDNSAIDAVIVAAPTQWQARIGLRALLAGKDLYVEAPAARVFCEGGLLVEAAQRHGRVVQHGTLSRSSRTLRAAAEALRAGLLGQVTLAKAWNVRGASAATPPPSTRQARGARSVRAWESDGIHELDLARWLLGADDHPTRITAHGSRLVMSGSDTSPGVMLLAYQYADGRVLLYEDRRCGTPGPRGLTSGVALYGSLGEMICSRRGDMQILVGASERPLPDDSPPPRSDDGAARAAHLADFLRCVRTRERTTSPPEEAHRSCGLVHLGHIAHRLQSILEFDPLAASITNRPEGNTLLTEPSWAADGMPQTV